MINFDSRSFQNLQQTFFFVSLSAASVLFFLILRPFLKTVFFALVLSVVFYPLHRSILKLFKGRPIPAALFSLMGVFVLALLPLTLVGLLLFKEAGDLYLSLSVEDGLISRIAGLTAGLESRLDFLNLDLSRYLRFEEYGRQGLVWLLDNFSAVFSNLLRMIFNMLILVLALFFFFKDGARLRSGFLTLSPLPLEHNERILSRLAAAINSSVRGRILLGVVQGVFALAGFLIFSVPNPVFWGTVAAIFSILPGLGPALVLLPVAFYVYFLLGNSLAAAGLLAWTIVSVAVIDNYLGSKIVERGMGIHPFLILLSIFGGLSLFGPLGFVLGPVSLGLFFALLDIYPLLVKKV